MKYWFRNDYSYGAHPLVMNAVLKACEEGNAGYGEDRYTEEAREVVRRVIGCPDAMVEFMVGGTQANVVAISYLLRPWEAVIAPESGHLNGHEAGALEAAGHKILTADGGREGKITPEMIKPIMEFHKCQHLVKPALVYITNPTESGVIYTKNELEELSSYCRKEGLILYADGARLGSAMTAKRNDMTMEEFASLVDAFYIGGTKNGTLFGEALVIKSGFDTEEFFRMKKRMFGVMEKGWLAGAMFTALLKDGLYFDMARHSNLMAEHLLKGLEELGWEPWLATDCNQIFVIADRRRMKILEELLGECEVWGPYGDGGTIVRLTTCFNTREEDVRNFLRDVAERER